MAKKKFSFCNTFHYSIYFAFVYMYEYDDGAVVNSEPASQ